MNRGKYILSMTLSILLICVGGLLTTGYSIVFISNIDTPYIYGGTMAYISLALMACANLAIGVASLILCLKTTKSDANTNMLLSVIIALLFVSILSSTIRIIEFATLYSGIELFFYLLFVVLAFITVLKKNTLTENKPAAPLPIANFDEKQSESVLPLKQAESAKPAELTLGSKIAQIKRLRELCLISDELAKDTIGRLITVELEKNQTTKEDSDNLYKEQN